MSSGLICFGLAALAPATGTAQVLQCVPELSVQALGGPIFLLGENVRISADIGAGSVTGGPPDHLDINTFSFLLDCSAGDLFPTCTDAGNNVIFVDNISSNCLDSNGDAADFQTNIVGNEVQFTTQSGLPVRNNANTTCNTQFDVRVDAIAEDNESATIIEILGFLDTEATCSNGLAAGASASLSFDITARRAQFVVTKDFSDDNPAGVDVQISCNTGLPLNQSGTISEFGDDGFTSVAFIVDAFDAGELDCHITESPVPDGYAESYAVANGTGIAGSVDADADGCHFLDVQEGTFICEVTDTLQPVEIDVTKEWFGDLAAAGLTPDAGADWTCQNVRSSPSDTTLGTEVGALSFSGNPDTESAGPIFPDFAGTSVCSVTEEVTFDAVETDDSDCASLPVSLGQGNSCTITNLVFFEGIPTLNHYGLMVLALLMLGVGVFAFRRIG
jgi:hypothetical protein